MMFLDLMPVVEKPEIVKAKEQKLKSLGQKYGNFFYGGGEALFLRRALCEF